jgi:hypothetical protein
MTYFAFIITILMMYLKKGMLVLLLLMGFQMAFGQTATLARTFTYLKAEPGHEDRLYKFIKKNWLAMDSVAQTQGLLKSYRLLKNDNKENTEWDVVVVVVYADERGYEGIKDAFEKIRQAQPRVLIDGKGMPELGRVVKSENVIE